MGDPGAGLGGVPGGGGAEDGSHAREMMLKGEKLKVPSPEYLQGIVAQNLSFDELKLKLEKDFPGYTLPNQEDIERLKLHEEHEGLRKLTEGFTPPDDKLDIFSCDDKGGLDRSRWSVSGNSFDKQPMNKSDETWPHLKPGDFLFLIKKTVN